MKLNRRRLQAENLTKLYRLIWSKVTLNTVTVIIERLSLMGLALKTLFENGHTARMQRYWIQDEKLIMILILPSTHLYYSCPFWFPHDKGRDQNFHKNLNLLTCYGYKYWSFVIEIPFQAFFWPKTCLGLLGLTQNFLRQAQIWAIYNHFTVKFDQIPIRYFKWFLLDW